MAFSKIFFGNPPSVLGALSVATGRYVGNGQSARSIATVGFQPKLVIVKEDAATFMCWRTDVMPNSKPWEGAFVSDRITSLDADGFSVGTNFNADGVEYFWLAVTGPSDVFKTWSYSGDGSDDRNLSDPGFQPEFAMVCRDSGASTVWRTPEMPAGDCAFRGGIGGDRIQAFNTSGIQVGTNGDVNTSGVTYYAVAIRGAGIATKTYTGDGTDDKNITGFGLDPVWLHTFGGSGTTPMARFGRESGDASFPDNSTESANRIQSFITDGFQAGTLTNANTVTYYAWAFSGTILDPSSSTVTASAIASAEAFGTTTVVGPVTIGVNGIATAEAFGTATITREPGVRFVIDERDDTFIGFPFTPTPSAGWEWTDTSEARMLRRTRLSNQDWSFLSQDDMGNDVSGDGLILVAISPPLQGAQTVAGSIKGVLHAWEQGTTNNIRSQLVVKAVSGDGSTLRGTLLDFDTSAISSEWDAGSEESRKFPLAALWGADGVALTSTACQDGDRLLIEVGFRAHGTTGPKQGYVQIGDLPDADLPENETTTAAGTGWFEFSQALDFYTEIIPRGITSGTAFGTASLVQNISCSGIASVEAFGSATVSPGAVSVTASGIATAEAFGTATITPGAVSLSPTGIATAEAFGTATLSYGAASLSPTGIATAESFGTTTVSPGAVTVTAVAIASAEAFGTTTVSPGAVTITASSVTSAEAFGVTKLNLNVSPTGIASAVAFGTTTVAPGMVAVSPTGIPSSEAFGTATLNLNILTSGIATAEAFGVLTVSTAAATITATAIASTEAFGTPTLTPGPVTVTATGIASTEAFGSIVVSPGAVSLAPTSIASAEAFGAATVLLVQSIVVSSISSTEAFGSATVSPGAVTITASGVASSEAFGSLVLTPGAVSITFTGISSTEAFGAAVLSIGPVTLRPTGIATAETFGAAVLTPGPVTITTSGIPSAQAFGTAAVSYRVAISGIASEEAVGSPNLRMVVALAGIASAQAVGSVTVTPGAVSVSVPGISSGEAFGDVTLAAGVQPDGIPSAEAFGTPILTSPIMPTGIASEETFGTPQLNLTIYVTGIASAEAFGLTAIGTFMEGNEVVFTPDYRRVSWVAARRGVVFPSEARAVLFEPGERATIFPSEKRGVVFLVVPAGRR